MKNFSFHNDIAIPLEVYGKKIIGSNCKTSDEIESGAFVDTMLSIISIKHNGLTDLKDFVETCKDYDGLPASQIPKEKAQEIFNDFKRIMNINTKGQ